MIGQSDNPLQAVLDLKTLLAAAETVMHAEWSIYRDDRADREKLRRYVVATDRCQEIKEEILRTMTAPRLERMAS